MTCTRLAPAVVATTLFTAFALDAHAARVAGKECAGMVSTQRNPQTNEVTRSCRTVDGSIATEHVTVRDARKDRRPAARIEDKGAGERAQK